MASTNQGEQPKSRTVPAARGGGLRALRVARGTASAVAVAALPVLALTAPAATAQTTATVQTTAATIPANATARVNEAAPNAVPGPPSGWTTQFSDDFNGSSGIGRRLAVDGTTPARDRTSAPARSRR